MICTIPPKYGNVCIFGEIVSISNPLLTHGIYHSVALRYRYDSMLVPLSIISIHTHTQILRSIDDPGVLSTLVEAPQ